MWFFLLLLFAGFCFWMAFTHPNLKKKPCPNCNRPVRRLSTNGLCEGCEIVVVGEVSERHRVMQQSMKLIQGSKKMDTRLSRCDLVLNHAEALLEYEKKGITTIEPPPSQILAEYRAERDQIVIEGTREEVDSLLGKADVATTLRSALNHTSKALMKIREARAEASGQGPLDEMEHRVQLFAQEAEVRGYLEQARKAEFKGKEKKALDQYQEALYALRGAPPELRDRYVEEIEGKVQELGSESKAG